MVRTRLFSIERRRVWLRLWLVRVVGETRIELLQVEPERGESLELQQPQVSKHLKVLREVGLVACDRVGRQRVYRVNGAALRPIHDWVRSFEQLWNDRYDRLDDLLVELQEDET